MPPLLTIAIPTYNRASCLDTCLSSVSRQMNSVGADIEIIVSDNSTNKASRDIVDAYILKGMEIKYFKNVNNIGADRNFLQCYQKATGKYIWLLGDDDVMLEGAIDQVITLIKQDVYGVINLNAYAFRDSYHDEMPRKTKPKVVVYGELADFFRRVNFWITFVSANVFRKSDIDPELFIGSYLPHVYWTVSVALAAKANCRVEQYLVAFKSGNSGGYNLFNVFGPNLDGIIKYFVNVKNLDPCLFSGIRRALLLGFFPSFIVNIRSKKLAFDDAKSLDILGPIYRSYFLYWIAVVPSARLPLAIAVPWGKAMTLCSVILRKCFE